MSSACPSSRSGHVAAVINDEMLLWGGAVVNEAEVTYFCSHDLIECFNLLTSQWNQRRATVKSPSDLPPLCANAKIGVVQNRDIYQFGGYFKSSEGRSFYWNDFHKLDGSTLQWEKILPNDQSTPSERFDHGLCVLGKKGDEHVVMMGGGGTKRVSPTPEGYQFIPHETCPYEAYNNEVWLFSVRKRHWIAAQCTGEKPYPRAGHSFTGVDDDRAVLIGGITSGAVLNDAFLFVFSSLEWIKLRLDDHLLPRFFHSTVVVDTPTFGSVALILWGFGKNFLPLSLVQIILIDFLNLKKVSISEEPIPTGKQSVCCILRRGLLFILRFGGSPYDANDMRPEALLDIFKYDFKNSCEKLLYHDLNESIKPEICDEIAPFRSKSPTMTRCEGMSSKEREISHSTPQRVEDVISVATAESALIFARSKKISTPVSLVEGAEISIPNTGLTLRIQSRGGGSSIRTSMGLNVFKFDAKQSQGVSEDEFVSDLIQLSLPSAENDVEIEICHEHGLNPCPSESKTSASRVVFFYQPHDPSAKMEHSIEFDEKIVIVRAGQPKIAALLQLSIVKILVSPPAPAAAPAAVSSVDDVTLSFFTYFYGLGREMVMQYNPSHLEMNELASVMGSQWKIVAKFIVPVLTDYEIRKIEIEERENQPVHFLKAWVNKHGLKATREALYSALFCSDLGSGARKIFPEIYENMTKKALLRPDLQIEKDDLVFDEDKDFIGSGGYGEVYKATLKRRGIERTVAIKLFFDFMSRKTENEYELFRKEASILLRIKPNDNIVNLIGLCAVPRHYALVTEFVNGGSLSTLLTSPEHEEAVEKWQTRILFAKQIAEGMLHLHYNHPSIIHLDLKAQNVLVNILPNVAFPFICKVTDFGLSKLAGVSSVTTERRDSSPLPGGTVSHIAPERFRDRPYGDGDDHSKMDLARKADVYSYGVVLWEIREKQRPFEDMINDLICLHVMNGGELPSSLATNVPPLFNKILEQCVKFKPQERLMFRDILLMITEGEQSLNH